MLLSSPQRIVNSIHWEFVPQGRLPSSASFMASKHEVMQNWILAHHSSWRSYRSRTKGGPVISSGMSSIWGHSWPVSEIGYSLKNGVGTLQRCIRDISILQVHQSHLADWQRIEPTLLYKYKDTLKYKAELLKSSTQIKGISGTSQQTPRSFRFYLNKSLWAEKYYVWNACTSRY